MEDQYSICYLSTETLNQMIRDGVEPTQTDQAQAKMRTEHRERVCLEKLPSGKLNHREGYSFVSAESLVLKSDLFNEGPRKQRKEQLIGLWRTLSPETRILLSQIELKLQQDPALQNDLPRYLRLRQEALEQDPCYKNIMVSLGLYHHPYEGVASGI